MTIKLTFENVFIHNLKVNKNLQIQYVPKLTKYKYCIATIFWQCLPPQTKLSAECFDHSSTMSSVIAEVNKYLTRQLAAKLTKYYNYRASVFLRMSTSTNRALVTGW